MKKILLLVSLVLISFTALFAQSRNVMVLENLAKGKNFKYFEGDKIEVETTDSVTVKGMITAIKDSTFVLDFYSEISIHKIKTVYRTRALISILSKVMMIGGAGLVILEAVNGAISSSSMNENLLYTGVGITAAGALMIPFQKAKYPIGPGQSKLKILAIDTQFDYQKNKSIKF
jgi:hypothetical protein